MFLVNLLNILKGLDLDAYLMPVADEHFNEIIGPSDARVKALSGFTGFYGNLLVTTVGKGVLFTSEQYLDTAKQEVKDFDVVVETPEGLYDFIKNRNLKRIGIFTKTIKSKKFLKMKNELLNMNVVLVPFDNDLFDKVWADKPKRKFNKIFSLQQYKIKDVMNKDYIKQFNDLRIKNDKGKFKFKLSKKLPGESRKKKFKRIKKLLKSNEGVIVTDLNTIGWLSNYRGSDISFSSKYYAFAYLTKDKITIFTDQKFKTKKLNRLPYDKFYEFIGKLKNKKTYISGDANYYIYSRLRNPAYMDDIEIEANKKNQVEILGFKLAGIKDGAALVKLFSWLEMKNKVSEQEIANQIIYYKKNYSHYYSESFNPIIAMGTNSRDVYHKPTNEIINNDDIVLIDTGSHYYHGTTDMTRTLYFGKPMGKFKKFYTGLLKGLLQVQSMHKTKIEAREIDSAAKHQLKDMKSKVEVDTGHGVSHFGDVHNDLIRISSDSRDVIKENSTFAFEPSYFDDCVGMRLENLMVLSIVDGIPKLETLTYTPYQLNMIDTTMLTYKERKMINEYSRSVRSHLYPLLKNDPDALKYLLENTKELGEK